VKRPISNSTSRARDLVIYLAISLAVMMLAVVLARSNLSQAAISQWFGLAFYSAVLYGVFIQANWPSRRLRQFWLVTVVAFSLHAAVFAAIVVNVTAWRPIWSAVMFLELPLLDRAKDRFVPVRKGRHSQSEQ
jgi:hypothetical protein